MTAMRPMTDDTAPNCTIATGQAGGGCVTYLKE